MLDTALHWTLPLCIKSSPRAIPALVSALRPVLAKLPALIIAGWGGMTKSSSAASSPGPWVVGGDCKSGTEIAAVLVESPALPCNKNQTHILWNLLGLFFPSNHCVFQFSREIKSVDFHSTHRGAGLPHAKIVRPINHPRLSITRLNITIVFEAWLLQKKCSRVMYVKSFSSSLMQLQTYATWIRKTKNS